MHRHRGALQHLPLLPGPGAGANLHPHRPHDPGDRPAAGKPGEKRPGILATDGTIRTGLYQREFAAFGIYAAAPRPAAQKQVMSLIYDDIKAGKAGDPEKFAAFTKDLVEQGCDCAVLACTELSVFANQHHLSPFYVDAMAVLAQRSIELCHKPLRAVF